MITDFSAIKYFKSSSIGEFEEDTSLLVLNYRITNFQSARFKKKQCHKVQNIASAESHHSQCV